LLPALAKERSGRSWGELQAAWQVKTKVGRNRKDEHSQVGEQADLFWIKMRTLIPNVSECSERDWSSGHLSQSGRVDIVSSKSIRLFAIVSGIVALAVLGVWIAAGAPSPIVELERFFWPPERWSVSDYGFYGDDEAGPGLSRINTPERAEAMLRLLDRTIGTAQDTVLPEDLADALEQIRNVAPQLAQRESFRRLEVLARRAATGGPKSP
jgi:hypothetical protein